MLAYQSVVGIGWVTLSGASLVSRELFAAWATERWGAPAECSSGRGYRKGLEWVSGLRLLFEGIGGGEHSSIVADGDFCDLHQVELPGLIREWYKMGFCRCTRIDSFLDFCDGAGRGLIAEVEASCDRGELAGARQFHVVRPRRAGGAVLGETVYVGSRSSDFYLRVYDKSLESGKGDRGDYVRWEAELKGDFAAFAVRCLLRLVAVELGEDVGPNDVLNDPVAEAGSVREWGVACALSGLSFVLRRAGDRSVKRAALVQWWAKFSAGVARHVRVAAVRVAGGLERFERWFHRQVARKASEYLAALGGDVCQWLDRLRIQASVAVSGKLTYAVRASIGDRAGPVSV